MPGDHLIKRYACAAAVALLATGAGCGGDDEEPLSKAEYINQADAICKKLSAEGEKQTEEMFKDLGPSEEPSEEQLTSFVEDVLGPNIRRQVDELRELSPPEADEDTVDAIYDELEEGLAKIEEDPKVLFSKDDPLEPANDAAADYGLEDCSE